uniref:Uncharacterized protein ycf20 n=1 Tax=Rhodochaete parvula TaxID=110510 RepID=A0A1X9PWJ3_9RHOD|nr:conserved hypothetical plastid protein [Rhodochaete parvula]
MISTYLAYPLGRLTVNLISLLSGFFFATVLATLPSQTGDWGIVAGLVAIFELISFVVYKSDYEDSLSINILNIYIFNSIKIGIIYGLFVDAFKLGS